jgi:hypothetical protein
LGIFANEALAQSDDVDIAVELSLRDLKEIDRRLQDYDLLKEVDKAKDDRISNLEKDLGLAQKELDLEKRENDLNQRMITLQQREIDLQKQSFDQMAQVADKSLKLAEMGKKSTASEILEWVIRIALFAAGIFAAR